MRRATLLLAAIAATSCSPQPESPTGSIALVNARVYTMNADAPEADAVVVRNDSILYVGDAAGAEPFIGESTDVRDLGSMTGFKRSPTTRPPTKTRRYCSAMAFSRQRLDRSVRRGN
jgi:hypothetical protein